MLNISQLNLNCRRVLGALLEKEQTTPDYYPLTLNALIAACNQTTNRNPVLALKRHEVLSALHQMSRDGLVQRVTGPRADRWSHLLIQPLLARPENKAVLTVLLLRGAQTPGELKARTDRMHAFASLHELEESLQRLSASEAPLVRELPRRPGQKETRWALMPPADGESVDGESEVEQRGAFQAENEDALQERVEKLEEQVRKILQRLDDKERS